MGRAPNEMPGRPVGKIVPTWGDNDRAGAEDAPHRAAAEWRRGHPRSPWWRRLFRRRSSGGR